MSTAAANAQTVEPFYKGRTMTLVLSFAPGGLNDIAARLVAQHLGRFIPGSPTIVVQNMPGAGGLTAANYLYNLAPKDGSVIGQLERSMAQAGIRGARNVKFDTLKFIWLGSLSNYDNEAYLLWVNSTHPAKAASDLNRPGMTTRLGAVSGGTNLMMQLVARDILGLHVEIVRGYPGGQAIWLAMQRGEVDGQTISYSAVMAEQPQLWESKAIRPLVQFGRATRLGLFPDIPMARELAPDANARAVVEFSELLFATSLPSVAPPGVPPDRADALRNAFRLMVTDKAFVDDAAKRHVELSPVDSEQIMRVLERAAATPKDVIARYNAIADPQN
jgi:tripartite-type tricarboxylate transporter receptor subunit TctC